MERAEFVHKAPMITAIRLLHSQVTVEIYQLQVGPRAGNEFMRWNHPLASDGSKSRQKICVAIKIGQRDFGRASLGLSRGFKPDG